MDDLNNFNSFNKLEKYAARQLRKHMFSMRSEVLHPYAGMRFLAYMDTLKYIEANFHEALACMDQNELFNCALEHMEIKGLKAEFGVKKGGSLKALCQKKALRKDIIYGFDSFEGLPENWFGTRIKKGRLTSADRIPKLPKNTRLVKGLFADTLPHFIKEHKGIFAFIHIDCDIYSSTKDIFDNIGPRIEAGTVIVFDEYFNYPNWRHHEYKAFQEFIALSNLKYKYLAYSTTQVAVIIL